MAHRARYTEIIKSAGILNGVLLFVRQSSYYSSQNGNVIQCSRWKYANLLFRIIE